MAQVKRQKGIIYLEKDRLTFFGSSTNTVVQFAYPKDTISNLDIMNEEVLIAQLTSFLQTNKIQPAVAGIVLADNVLFAKDVEPITLAPLSQPAQNTNPAAVKSFQAAEQAKLLHEKEEEQTKSIQKFLDNVPFETVASKTYKLEKGSRVIAANRDFFDFFKTFFENNEFIIDPIVVTLALGKNVSLAQGLTPVLGRVLIPRLESLKKETLLIPKETYSSEKHEEKKNESQKTDKKRIAILGGVFVLLLSVAGLMFVRMQAENAALIEKNKKQTAPVVLPVEVVPTTPAASDEADLIGTDAARLKQVSITIISTTRTSTQAATLSDALEKAGFTNISGTTDTVLRARTLVVLSNTITKDIQDIIVSAVAKITSAYTVQQNTNEEPTAVISLGIQ